MISPKSLKPYEPPALIRHGDLRALTRGGIASSKEGGGTGNPNTKV